MKKYLISLITSSLLLVGCGGGGGSVTSEIDSQTETIIFPIIPDGVSIDYSDYAWAITPKDQLNSSLDSKNVNINANINMPSISTNQKIKVAIIDQGFQYNHPDIYDKVIDLKIINNSVLTDEYHGTAVMGALASTYLGVAPNNVELILININYDIVSEADLIEAFNYAKDQGAKIINCSWGSTYDENTSYSFSTLYTNTIQAMKDAGINVVFSSGNNGYNLDTHYMDEAELDSVIGVGATSKDNEVTPYSNYGSNIDIYAPGGTTALGIMGLDLTGDNGSSIENYTYWTGTSIAAPIISGTIALMLSQNPNLTPDEIKNILIDNTVSDTINTSNPEGTSFTYLKVNANNAINKILNP